MDSLYFNKQNDSGYQSHEPSPNCDASVLKNSSTPLTNLVGQDKGSNPRKRLYDDEETADPELVASPVKKCYTENNRKNSDCDNYDEQLADKNWQLLQQQSLQAVSVNHGQLSEQQSLQVVSVDHGQLSEQTPLQIQVKLVNTARDATMCETSGRETILSMIKRMLEKYSLKKPISLLIFKNIRTGSALNLGLPTGTLKEDEQYQCIFKEKLEYNTSKMVREFEVERYSKQWDTQSFCVKFDNDRESKPHVTKMSKVLNLIEVPFFKGETFYEALCRDGRFDIEKKDGSLAISQCDLQQVGSTVKVPIDNNATRYDGMKFEFYHSKAHISHKVEPLTYPPFLRKNVSFPDYSLPQKRLALTYDHPVTPVQSEQSPAQGGASAPDNIVQGSESTKKLIPHSDEELKNFIENTYDIKITKEKAETKESKRLKKINKFVKNGCDLFALSQNCQLGASKVKKLSQLCDSTAAIVIELTSGVKMFRGTCFRVGPKYVITNEHVWKFIKEKHQQGMLKKVHVDFLYMGNNSVSQTSCTVSRVVIKSKELDYVVLQVSEPNNWELPKSVTSFFTIPPFRKCNQEGVFLTFSGHPEGSNETVTDWLCPLKSPDTLDNRVVIGLSMYDRNQLRDPRRQTYDVSTFFHGSSGSPGVLIHEGYLMVLHCRGFFLQDDNQSKVEQGILMSAIVEDVKQKLGVEKAEELFDLPTNMEVDNN
ncbi:uncharacterized protein LOC110243120 isoform X2 [Exaiptasia diaphana]|uniref:Serine protease n=1 Tax=Exaiptasia diaphana TaxID=2652724 RepID=A0A913XI95_EXADI|nr:uncharacterized protein LOC110243120 isoform X2 [Exaiptasia diaphana]